jgi:hypothetical protein
VTTEEKLTAILAAVQIDPGNRGLARDPHDNLFTATRGDFEAACRSIAEHPKPILNVVTGFVIPTAEPPTFETDGPLGAVFLMRAFRHLGLAALGLTDLPCARSLDAGIRAAGVPPGMVVENFPHDDAFHGPWVLGIGASLGFATHAVALERVGPAANGRYHTMRGRDVTDLMLPAHHVFARDDGQPLGGSQLALATAGTRSEWARFRTIRSLRTFRTATSSTAACRPITSSWRG